MILSLFKYFMKHAENGPMISKKEADTWEQNIKNGYKSWIIEKF